MDDLNARIESLLQRLSSIGLLNDQFQQLLQLEDDSNPTFVKVNCQQRGRHEQISATDLSNCVISLHTSEYLSVSARSLQKGRLGTEDLVRLSSQYSDRLLNGRS